MSDDSMDAFIAQFGKMTDCEIFTNWMKTYHEHDGIATEREWREACLSETLMDAIDNLGLCVPPAFLHEQLQYAQKLAGELQQVCFGV